MKRRITVCCTLLLLIACSLFFVKPSGAWFVAGSEIGNGEFDTALVIYNPSLNPDQGQKNFYGSLLDGSSADNTVYIVPGQSLLNERTVGGGSATALEIENFSTVATNVRLSVNIKYTQITYQGDAVIETPADDLIWISGGDRIWILGRPVADENDATIVYFMGLIAVTMGQGTGYGWTYLTNEGLAEQERLPLNAEFWELRINGGSELPAAGGNCLEYGSGMSFMAIEDIAVVGDMSDYTIDPRYTTPTATKYNSYFTDVFAGGRLQLGVYFYAKQQPYMAWNLFTSTVFDTIRA